MCRCVYITRNLHYLHMDGHQQRMSGKCARRYDGDTMKGLQDVFDVGYWRCRMGNEDGCIIFNKTFLRL